MAKLPPTMSAAVYRGPRQVALETRPLPELGPEDVLLRVSHCGVCGTDLHLALDGWGLPDTIGGHEYSGRIAALGPRVEGWAVGDAAVGIPEPSCGRCEYCREGHPSLCSARGPAGLSPYQGAFAEYVRVGVGQLRRVPEGLALREAALAEPLAVALHAVSQSRVEAGQRALVTGAGPIGLLVLAALRARGVRDVRVSEPAAARRTRALEIGAAAALEPDALPEPPMPFQVAQEPVHAAFECSGNPRAFRAALAQLRKTGTLVIVGTGMEKPRLDANRVLLNELRVVGAYNYDENGLADALALLASGALPTHLLIEPDDVPLTGLFAAMERLAAGEVAGKVMVVPRAQEDRP